ncbi:MAG: DUF5671 domain-containing protein, partial [Actinomycetota bacterium]
MTPTESQPLPPSPDAAPRFTGRAAYVISQLYYYLVAIVAFGFVIGGTIVSLIALRGLVLPDPGTEASDSVRGFLQGLAFAVPAFVAAWWHLVQARRRQGLGVHGEFWGRSLYLHGVAFMAYGVTLGGVIAALFSLVEAAFAPDCPAQPSDVLFDFCTSA